MSTSRKHSDYLTRFGLPSRIEDAPEIRRCLELESTRQDDPDSLRLLCAQLFSLGAVEDSLAIWNAKTKSFDNGASIDVQLLCGAGLEPTLEFLASHGSPDAKAAFVYLGECIAAGDFNDFSVAGTAAENMNYFGAAG